MRLSNFQNYGMCLYVSTVTGKDKFKLGDVVINKENEIGVVIQIHGDGDLRTDMFGNEWEGNLRMATNAEIEKYRPNILKQGNFKH